MVEAFKSAPAAEGKLSDTPFGHLLLYLDAQRSSGTLMVADQDGCDATILLQDGRAVSAVFNPAHASITRGLTALCGIRSGRFAFYNENMLSEQAPVVSGSVDPYTVLSMAQRTHARDDVVDRYLAPYAHRAMRMQPGFELGRLALEPRESAVVELLMAEPARPDELARMSPLEPERVRRILYVLAVTKAVAPFESSATSERPASAPPAPTSRASNTRVRAASPRPGSDRPSPSGTRRHRDVTPSGPLAPAWQQLAARGPGAYSSTPPRRPSSSRPFRPPSRPNSSTRSTRPSRPAAPTHFPTLRHKADHAAKLFQGGEYADAETLVEELIAADGNSPGYRSLRAWMLMRRSGPADVLTAKLARDAVEEALALDDADARANYTKGMLLKWQGEDRAALRSFMRAVQAEPRHIDAKREIRLARARMNRG